MLALLDEFDQLGRLLIDHLGRISTLGKWDFWCSRSHVNCFFTVIDPDIVMVKGANVNLTLEGSRLTPWTLILALPFRQQPRYKTAQDDEVRSTPGRWPRRLDQSLSRMIHVLIIYTRESYSISGLSGHKSIK